MDERKFKIMLIWMMPLALLLVTFYEHSNELLLPMWIALPFGMLFSYLIYIKGIEDEKLFELFEKNPKER